MTKCGFEHFDLLSKGDHKNMFPVVLKPEILEKCGFSENMKYPLRPEAKEFILILPVIGESQNELRVYIKSNGESFGRAMTNNIVVSNNFYHLHQLQNLYVALTGQEMELK